MLELHHWEPNGNWLKPLIALHEKGLPFRSHYVDVPTLEHHVTGPLARDPECGAAVDGESPVLLDGGVVVCDGFCMLLYLEDAWPRVPLGPGSPRGNAALLEWGRFVGERLAPAVGTLGCHRHLVPRLAAPGVDRTALEARLAHVRVAELQGAWRQALDNAYPPELLADSWRKVRLGAGRLDRALAASGWLVGSGYTLADIDAFAVCNALPALTPEIVNEQATPRLLNWIHRIRGRTAVQAALASGREACPEQAFVPGPEQARWA